jgi:hypothetical protein
MVGLAVAGIWLGLLTASPVFADGLARFEKSIKPQIPPGTLTYKSSKALGDDGFELEGVVITRRRRAIPRPTSRSRSMSRRSRSKASISTRSKSNSRRSSPRSSSMASPPDRMPAVSI